MSKRRKKSADRPAVKSVVEPSASDAQATERDDGALPNGSPSLYLDLADPPKKRPWLLLTAGVLLAVWNLFLLFLALTASS